MMKSFTKVLIMVMTGIIFTLSLAGCNQAETSSQPEVFQPEISLEISSAPQVFSMEELETAKKQLTSITEVLINSTVSDEPIKDGSHMSMENIWRFIFSITNLKKEGNPYPPDLYQEQINRTFAVEDGQEYTIECKYLSMENVQQIAYEFFGVDSFFYNQYYDAEQEGYVIPPRGFSYKFTYKDLVIDAKPDGSITADIILLSSYDETKEYGKYRFEYKLMHENERTFIRFLHSSKI